MTNKYNKTSENYIQTDWTKVPGALLIELLADTFGIVLNANDTFSYASADAETIDTPDIGSLLEAFEKFGSDGTTAFMALYCGQDVIRELQTDRYWEAKKFLATFKRFEDQ